MTERITSALLASSQVGKWSYVTNVQKSRALFIEIGQLMDNQVTSKLITRHLIKAESF